MLWNDEMSRCMYPLTHFISLCLQVITVVITGLSIAGIANAQLPQAQHFFIVILVLIVFIGVVSAGAYSCRSKSNYNYEVNEDVVKPTKGRENQAFQVTTNLNTNGGLRLFGQSLICTKRIVQT